MAFDFDRMMARRRLKRRFSVAVIVAISLGVMVALAVPVIAFLWIGPDKMRVRAGIGGDWYQGRWFFDPVQTRKHLSAELQERQRKAKEVPKPTMYQVDQFGQRHPIPGPFRPLFPDPITAREGSEITFHDSEITFVDPKGQGITVPYHVADRPDMTTWRISMTPTERDAERGLVAMLVGKMTTDYHRDGPYLWVTGQVIFSFPDAPQSEQDIRLYYRRAD